MKIISDGTSQGTKLYTDNGELIADVVDFTVHGQANGSFIFAIIKILKPKIDLKLENNKIEWIIEE